MGRDLRWEVIDRASDPTPWDLERVTALKNYYDSLYQAAYDAYELSKSGGDLESGKGEAMDALKELMRELPGMLEKTYTSYEQARDAYGDYYTALETVQDAVKTAITNGAPHYDAWKADPEDEDAKSQLDVYRTNAENAISTFQEAVREIAGNLEDAADAGIEERNPWEKVVDWFEDNPWVKVALAITAGVLMILLPGAWVILAVALGGFLLALDVTSLIESGKFGWNWETVLTLGLGLLSMVPGFALARGMSLAGRGITSVTSTALTRSGTIGAGIRSAAASVRTAAGGTAVARSLGSSRAWYSSVRAGTWRSPLTSTVTHLGIQGAQDFGVGLAANMAVNALTGQNKDFGQLALETLLTTTPGAGAAVYREHVNFSLSGGFSLTGGDTIPSAFGVNDLSPHMSTDSPNAGNYDGLTSEFANGSGTITSGDGTQTSVTTPDSGGSGGPQVSTTTPDDLSTVSTYDSTGNLTDTRVTIGNDGPTVVHSPDSAAPSTSVTTTLPDQGTTTPPTATTTAIDGGVTSSGDFGSFSFDRSTTPAGETPTAHYSHGDSGGGTNLQVDFPGNGTVQVRPDGDTGTPPLDVRTTPDSLTVTTPDSTVTTTTTPDGGHTTTVTSSDGTAGPSYDSGAQQVSVTTDTGPATATRTETGTRLEGPDGTTVDVPADRGAPTQIHPGGSGGPESISHDPVHGTVDVRSGDSVVTANGSGDLLVGNSADTVRITQSGDGAGHASSGGASASWNGDGSATYGSSGSRSPSGDITFGDTTARPDGTVSHPGFAVRDDGTLTVRETDGTEWTFDSSGQVVAVSPSVAPDATPPWPVPDPATGAPMHTASDGTRVVLGPDGTGVTTSDGWTVTVPRGGTAPGDVQVRGPRDGNGDALTITHTADGGVRAESGGYATESGPGGVTGRTPDGQTAHSSGAGDTTISSGAWHTDVGSGDVTVTHPGGRIALDGDGAVGNGTPSAGSSWRVEATRDGTVGATTGSGAGVTAPRDGDVVFDRNGTTQATQSPDGEVTVSDRGLNVTGRPGDGAVVDGGPDRPQVQVRPDGSSVLSPDGQAHHVETGSDGVQRVHVNEGADGQPVIASDGSVRVETPNGTVEARADGFDARGNGNSHVHADGTGTSVRTDRPFQPETTVTHAPTTSGGADPLVTVSRDGTTTTYDTTGPLGQGPDAGSGSTAPSLTRQPDGTYTVETRTPHRGEHPTPGPLMERNPETGTSGVSHGDLTIRQTGSDGSGASPTSTPGVEVRPAPDAPTTRHNPDGSSTMEGRDVTVHRSADGQQTTVAPASGDGPRVLWEGRGPGEGGTVRVTDGSGGPLLSRDPDGIVTAADGQVVPRGATHTPADGGPAITHAQDGTVTVGGGDPRTTVTIDPRGRTEVTTAGSHETVRISESGTATTTSAPSGDRPTTTVRQFTNGQVAVDHRPPAGQAGQHSTTRIDEFGAAESRVRTVDADGNRVDSWAVGIDQRGQVTSADTRIWHYNTEPVRLRPSGMLHTDSNLREIYLSGGQFRPDGTMTPQVRQDMRTTAVDELKNDSANAFTSWASDLAGGKSPLEAFTGWMYGLIKGSGQGRWMNTPGLGENSWADGSWKFVAEVAKVNTVGHWEDWLGGPTKETEDKAKEEAEKLEQEAAQR
ncbi:beta strand repeat-containing protein [Marinactinospora thermotolerans]|uniref:beta strand repeat-containing protein n=1 Tax=Marinactinospora thermotolerans TaxID=531310 RepID=UPI003D8FD5BC